MHQNEDLGLVYRLFPMLSARRAQPAGIMSSGGEQQMIPLAWR